MPNELDSLSVRQIMTRWPATTRVFIDWRLHCIGCPIGELHRLADAALEHGYPAEALAAALTAAIAGELIPAAPARSRRRPAAADADP
jgi:hybrid cluster-associated redox disulfide protein